MHMLGALYLENLPMWQGAFICCVACKITQEDALAEAMQRAEHCCNINPFIAT